MKFRTGLIVGLAAGYVLGAKAGRERYEKIVALSNKVRSNEAVRKAADVAERTTRGPRGMAGDRLVHVARTVRAKAEQPKATAQKPESDQPDSR
jgi:hypothetical protein